MVRQVEFEAPSWGKIYSMLLAQAERIRSSGFKPDVIVGVSRGGWLPARVLSDLLENPSVASVRAEFYVGIGETRCEPKLTQAVSVVVAGKRVLVVDEVDDSGESLKLVNAHIMERGAAEVRVATLYHKPESAVKPDYYGSEVTKWIVFPWEIKETVRKIWEKHKNQQNTEKTLDKLAAAGVPKRLIDRFLKELREAKAC